MKTVYLVIPLAILLNGFSFQVAAGQAPSTAEDYNNRGLERQSKGDLEGAIDDYTKAVGLKAKPNTSASGH